MTDCQRCGDPFPAVITGALYCNKTITVNCKGCPNTYQRPCNDGKGSYCTTSCRNSYMRKALYTIKEERTCKICGENFKATSSGQKSCGKHELECLFCGETFEVYSQVYEREGRGKYCSNSCSSFGQFNNTRIPKELIMEYKAPNDWAIRFKKTYGRKPSYNDFRAYFNTDSFPYKAIDKKLFKKTKDSRFEIIVENFLKDSLPEVVISRRLRRIYIDGSSFPKEIDLMIEELNLGFEVQDFATHSRDSNTDRNEFQFSDHPNNSFKKGPTYHEAKRTAAREQLGVTLIDIWEDEIKDGSYKQIICAAIDEARKQANLVK